MIYWFFTVLVFINGTVLIETFGIYDTMAQCVEARRDVRERFPDTKRIIVQDCERWEP